MSDEKGIFKLSTALTEVKMVQSKLVQNRLDGPDEETDAILISDVLICTLKDMPQPLLGEIYDKMLSSKDVIENDNESSKKHYKDLIATLSENNYTMACMLFRLLRKIRNIDDNDGSLTQLVNILTPTICRPTNSAYMSIKHMEDLKKIKPIISFFIENCDEVFKTSTQSKSDSLRDAQGTIVNGFSSSFNSSRGVPPLDSTIMSNLGTTSTGFSSPPRSLNPGNNGNFGGLTQLSSPPMSLSSVFNLGLSIDLECEPNKSVMHHNSLTSNNPYSIYSDTELKVLESLIYSKVNNILSLSDQDFQGNRSRTSSIDSGSSSLNRPPSIDNFNRHDPGYSDSMQLVTALDIHLDTDIVPAPPESNSHNNNQLSESSSLFCNPPASPEHRPNQNSNFLFSNSLQSGQSGISNTQVLKRLNRGKRRKMVLDCKSLRAQIFEFEQEYARGNGRTPKGLERGSMTSVYTRYRELKKEIRDLAATDIQRLCRGFLIRMKYYDILTLNRKQSLPYPQIQTKKSDLFNFNSLMESGNVSNNSTYGSTTNNTSAIPSEMYTKYRDLLANKRELKRKLKKFDEDFFDKYKRTPKKSDKEVIRPLYQKYHEIKSSLDELKSSIEKSHGPLPEELQEEKNGSSNNDHMQAENKSIPLLNSPKYTSYNSDGESEGGSTRLRTDSYTKYTISDDEGPPSSSKSHKSGDSATNSGKNNKSNESTSNQDRSNGVDLLTGSESLLAEGKNVAVSESNYEDLQVEKRNLHAYLKVYERDFNRTHGRPVMRHEDIQPVANEYQRYKELKTVLKDMKQHTAK